MNYCTINGSFEEDFFCKFIEEVKKFNQEEPLTVFISSFGGLNSVSDSFRYFFNTYPKDVTLVCMSNIDSCAYSLFMESNTRKFVTESSTAIIHLPYLEITSNDTKDKKNIIYKRMGKKGDNRKTVEHWIELFSKLGNSKSDIDTIKLGNDVMLFYDALKKQAATAEKLFYKPKE